MDLGCIDMGCVEKQRSAQKENSPNESMSSASKPGKNNRAKDAIRSSISALNKLTSQIGKPPRRKTSPINWFPRKKVEPYLKRKIKMLQEVDGMQLTLDETLGDSNPHYSRVLREKIAIREAADKAIKARKAAMVEASWCHILKTARIGNKEAEAELSKAETAAAEACQAARAIGVIMNDSEESLLYKTETSSTNGGEYTAHSISATFETAFEVDKQVAAAVKAAFIKLASCTSINQDDFKDLLRKISGNPDSDATFHESCSEVDSSSTDLDSETIVSEDTKLEDSDIFMANIVEMMLDRLKCLKEDELASLATIVATCGLSAALGESENIKNSRRSSIIGESEHIKNSRRSSIIGGATTRRNSRIANDEQLPSLDKFLVKRLTRLEREVLEAKNARNKNDHVEGSELKLELEEENSVPDLGSVLMKKHCSKLEKELQEAKIKDRKSFQVERAKQEAEEVPSLDKVLVKRLSRLEREVQEARNGKSVPEKENKDLNKIGEKDCEKSAGYESLDKVLVKHVSKLEREKSEFSCERTKVKSPQKNKEGGLGDVLVKHVSKLERAKLEFSADCDRMGMKSQKKVIAHECKEGGLDEVLVKPKSRLEKEKTASDEREQNDDGKFASHSVSRRQARERELQDAWGGLSLGNSIRPHVSRLEKDKAAWLKAENEERNREIEQV